MENDMKTPRSVEAPRALVKYVDAATDLAEAVKRCVQHNESVIDDDCVVKLSEFAAAASAVENLTSALKNKTYKINN